MIANPINACLGYFDLSRRFRSPASCMGTALAPLVECAARPARNFLDVSSPRAVTRAATSSSPRKSFPRPCRGFFSTTVPSPKRCVTGAFEPGYLGVPFGHTVCLRNAITSPAIAVNQSDLSIPCTLMLSKRFRNRQETIADQPLHFDVFGAPPNLSAARLVSR